MTGVNSLTEENGRKRAVRKMVVAKIKVLRLLPEAGESRKRRSEGDAKEKRLLGNNFESCG